MKSINKMYDYEVLEKEKLNIKCLAIMPFSNNFDSVLKTIEDAVSRFNSDKNNVVLKLHRADKSTKDPLLYQNVFTHINECDIAIVDLTGQNNNVVFEFGYSVAKGKYIIPLTQEDPRKFETDYKSYIYLSYQSDDLPSLELSLLLRFREINHIHLETWSF